MRPRDFTPRCKVLREARVSRQKRFVVLTNVGQKPNPYLTPQRDLNSSVFSQFANGYPRIAELEGVVANGHKTIIFLAACCVGLALLVIFR